MKKYLLSGVILFATLHMYAQKCGDHIELLGIGVKGKTTATITIDDWENVKSILAEVVYKSDSKPFTSEGVPLPVIFSTPEPHVQSVAGKPEQLLNSGNDPDFLKYVFRATLEGPAPQVDLVLPASVEGFYSFALYIHRNDGLVYTVKAGELVHVYHNEEHVKDLLSKKKPESYWGWP